MKNEDVLNINQIIVTKELAEIASNIKSTKLQWHRSGNIKKIASEAKRIYEAIHELKPDKLKDIKELTDELRPEFDLFLQSEAVVELLSIEAEVDIKKVKLSDLPADLTEREMASISWMVED